MVIFLWIGLLKFTEYEAKGIEPLVANSPFFAWALQSFGLRNLSNVIGVIEAVIGAEIIGVGQHRRDRAVFRYAEFPADNAGNLAGRILVPVSLADARVIPGQGSCAARCIVLDGGRSAARRAQRRHESRVNFEYAKNLA